MFKQTDTQAQKLPPKECQQFKVMMRLHDNKQYRKSLKAADSILKKCAGHGETLAMKGLILANLPERKDEAYDCAKKGLKLDIASSMCWHVVGILYRQDRDYGEAVRFFKRASALNKTHLGIMRDLTILLLHQREYDKHLEVRRQILDMRPKNKLNWVTFAMAHHLYGKLDACLALLNFAETNFDFNDPQEHSEFILYKAVVMEELGKYKDCSDYIAEMLGHLTDRTTALQIRGRVQVLQEDFAAAAKTFCELLEAFPNNDDWAVLCFVLHPTILRYFVWPSAMQAAANTPKLPGEAPCDDRGGTAVQHSAQEVVAEISPQLVRPSGVRRRAWLEDACNTWRYSDPTLQSTPAWTMDGGSTGVALGGSLERCWTTGEQYIATQLVGGALRPLKDKQDNVVWSADGKSVAGYCLDLEPHVEELFMSVCKELQAQHPKSHTFKSLPLFFAKNSNFTACVDEVVLPLVLKFAPSAFEVLRPAYCNRNAAKIHERLSTYESILTAATRDEQSTLLEAAVRTVVPPGTAAVADQVDTLRRLLFDSPMCLSAMYVLLAQHFDNLQDFVKAEQYINKAVEHTPTAVEIELIKGNILKRAGRYEAATAVFEAGRSMDLADRFVNVLATESLLRLGQIHKAEDVSRAFSKQSDSGGSLDMQCMWYELAKGRSWLRLRNYEMSMKQFRHVIKYYATFADDQFDFHQYCLRRQMYRTTVDFLRMQGHLQKHRFCRAATLQGIAVGLKMLYMDLFAARCAFDEPKMEPPPHTAENDADGAADSSPTAADTAAKSTAADTAAKSTAADTAAKSTAADTAAKSTAADTAAKSTAADTAAKSTAADTAAKKQSKKDTKPGKQGSKEDAKDTAEAKAEAPAADGKASLEDMRTWIDPLRRHCRTDPKTHAAAYDVYSHSPGLKYNTIKLQALSRLWIVSGCQTLSPLLAPRLAHYLRFLSETTLDTTDAPPADSKCIMMLFVGRVCDTVAADEDCDTAAKATLHNGLSLFEARLIAAAISKMSGVGVEVRKVINDRSGEATWARWVLSAEDVERVAMQLLKGVVQQFASVADDAYFLSALKTVQASSSATRSSFAAAAMQPYLDTLSRSPFALHSPNMGLGLGKGCAVPGRPLAKQYSAVLRWLRAATSRGAVALAVATEGRALPATPADCSAFGCANQAECPVTTHLREVLLVAVQKSFIANAPQSEEVEKMTEPLST